MVLSRWDSGASPGIPNDLRLRVRRQPTCLQPSGFGHTTFLTVVRERRVGLEEASIVPKSAPAQEWKPWGVLARKYALGHEIGRVILNTGTIDGVRRRDETSMVSP
jgi:hypothetical protein